VLAYLRSVIRSLAAGFRAGVGGWVVFGYAVYVLMHGVLYASPVVLGLLMRRMQVGYAYGYVGLTLANSVLYLVMFWTLTYAMYRVRWYVSSDMFRRYLRKYPLLVAPAEAVSMAFEAAHRISLAVWMWYGGVPIRVVISTAVGLYVLAVAPLIGIGVMLYSVGSAAIALVAGKRLDRLSDEYYKAKAGVFEAAKDILDGHIDVTLLNSHRPLSWFERDAETFGRVVMAFSVVQEVVRVISRLMKAVGTSLMMYGMYLVGDAPTAFMLYMLANTSVGMLASVIEELDALALVVSGWRVYDEAF
jgi:hypothetical protein